jgi:RecJ-like exonuclease
MEETHKYKKIRYIMEMACLFGTCPKCSYIQATMLPIDNNEPIGIHKVAIYDVYEVEEKTDCGRCSGTGTQKTECSACDGSGECPDCSGSGQELNRCETCKGEAKYWEDADGIYIGSVSELANE